ncbi:MAG: SulP family inorganic anion transporter, partial [Clostridia bacterium]|nr:SulP family inorganic anion transporter [Clostridia bacterium]
LLCGIFRLGKLVSLIPRPVITGFTSGIAVIIALGQVDNFFGTVSEGETAIQKLASYGTLGFRPHLWTLVLGLIVVAIMVIWPKKWNAKVPSSLIGIIVSTVVYVIFRFDGVATVGEIPKTLFLSDRLSFSGLNFDMIMTLLPSALTVAALGMIESLLCGASASRMKNEPFDANTELVGQGIGNILIPFFGGVPATAAIARTSVAIKSGAQTRLTGIFHALWLLAAMFLLGSVMALVPMSALGGVLLVTAWRMNEWHAIKYIFKKKFIGAILQFLITMIATVVFDLTVAIVIGIVFSLMVFIKNAAHIDVSCAEVDKNRLAPRGKLGCGHDNSVVVYVTGDIFFANIGKLSGKISELSQYDEIIVSLRGVPEIDISSVETLGELAGEFKASGKRMVFCGMNDAVAKVFERSGILDDLGEGYSYATIDKALIAGGIACADTAEAECENQGAIV